MQRNGPEGGEILQRTKKIGVKEHLVVVLSIAKYELLISNIRYPLRVVSRFLGPLVWVVPFLLFGKAILGGSTSETLYELTGISHMPTFILVGTIITLVSFNMLWLMAFAIRLESFRGTFESIYACPVSKFNFFLGKLVASTIWSSFYIIGLIVLGVMFLDVQLAWSRAPDALIIMILLFFAMFGFGLILAGTILVYKESHTILHFVDGLFSLIVPMAYPLEVLPIAIQKISLVLPMTQAVLAARNVLIHDESLLMQGNSIAILFCYIFILIPLGYVFYNYMERKAKKRGVLHKY